MYCIWLDFYYLSWPYTIKFPVKFLTSNFWCQTFDEKFDRVWDNLMSNKDLSQRFDRSNLFDIFWRTVKFLMRVWAPVKYLIKFSRLIGITCQIYGCGNWSARVEQFDDTEIWRLTLLHVCGQMDIKIWCQILTSNFWHQIFDGKFDRVWPALVVHGWPLVRSN